MNKFKPVEFSDEYIQRYWEGPSNAVARYYTYLQRGFGIVNESKNYFLIIFGSFWTAKAISILGVTVPPELFLIAGAVGIPILVLVGRWHLFKASKSIEFMTALHGSVTGYQGFNIQVRQVEQNDEIILQNKQIIELLKK